VARPAGRAAVAARLAAVARGRVRQHRANYKLVLNALALAASVTLLWLARERPRRQRGG